MMMGRARYERDWERDGNGWNKLNDVVDNVMLVISMSQQESNVYLIIESEIEVEHRLSRDEREKL